MHTHSKVQNYTYWGKRSRNLRFAVVLILCHGILTEKSKSNKWKVISLHFNWIQYSGLDFIMKDLSSALSLIIADHILKWFSPGWCLILKWSCDFLLYTKKEMSRVLFTLKYGCYHRSRSVVFNLPSDKPNNILLI